MKLTRKLVSVYLEQHTTYTEKQKQTIMTTPLTVLSYIAEHYCYSEDTIEHVTEIVLNKPNWIDSYQEDRIGVSPKYKYCVFSMLKEDDCRIGVVVDDQDIYFIGGCISLESMGIQQIVIYDSIGEIMSEHPKIKRHLNTILKVINL